MAGTLTLSTLSDGTNSTNATDVIRGSARAWVIYDGVAQTIRNSYNVSSITRNATGQFTLNFTNAMPDAYYSVSGSDVGSTQSYYYSFICSGGSILTTTSFRFDLLHQSALLVNQDYISIQVFR